MNRRSSVSNASPSQPPKSPLPTKPGISAFPTNTEMVLTAARGGKTTSETKSSTQEAQVRRTTVRRSGAATTSTVYVSRAVLECFSRFSSHLTAGAHAKDAAPPLINIHPIHPVVLCVISTAGRGRGWTQGKGSPHGDEQPRGAVERMALSAADAVPSSPLGVVRCAQPLHRNRGTVPRWLPAIAHSCGNNTQRWCVVLLAEAGRGRVVAPAVGGDVSAAAAQRHSRSRGKYELYATGKVKAANSARSCHADGRRRMSAPRRVEG